MTEPSGAAPAGWYYATGDPMGTQRYWDGTQWVGGPQWVQQPSVTYAGKGNLPGIGRTLAEPGRRVVARIIDALIETVVVMIPVIIWIAGNTDDLDDLESPPAWIYLIALGVGLYEVAFIALKGATPGKLAMGIEVIRQDGTSPPGWATAARRYVLNLVGAIPGIGGLASIVLFVISFVFLFSDDRRRTLPDRIASTYVVNARGRNAGGW